MRGIEADWEASSAYGDSANDPPMLGMVGKPHLVNPKPKTRELGKRHSCPSLEIITREYEQRKKWPKPLLMQMIVLSAGTRP